MELLQGKSPWVVAMQVLSPCSGVLATIRKYERLSLMGVAGRYQYNIEKTANRSLSPCKHALIIQQEINDARQRRSSQ
jgi:hypothetical protein